MIDLTDNPMLPIEQRLEIAIGGRDYFKQCHKNARQRVEVLEAENTALIADRDSWMQQANDRVKDWDDMRQERDALSAVVERQREAANKYLDNDGSRGCFDAMVLYDARQELNDALALTPATALRLHDAEVLERLAPAYERCDNEMDKYVAKCLRYNAFRLRAGGEG